MHNPICGVDGAVMACSHTGRRVLTHSEDNLEYQLWSADEFTCAACGAKAVILGMATISEHWKPDFERAKEQAKRARGGVLLAYYGKPPEGKPATLDAPAPSPLDAATAEAQTPPGHGPDVHKPAPRAASS